MKYLVFKYTGIAIPLEALAANGDLLFVGSKYNDKTEKMEYYKKSKIDSYTHDAAVMDDSEFLNEQPKED